MRWSGAALGHADELIKPVKVYMRRMGEVLGEEASIGSLGGSGSPQVFTCWQHTCKDAGAPVWDANVAANSSSRLASTVCLHARLSEALESLYANLAQLHK